MGKSSAVRAAAAALAACCLTAPASARRPADLFKLTPADFARAVAVKDDALETEARFDTQKGWVESPSDVFLRAYVDKRTGKVTYQIYAIATFFGDWRFYDRINYRDENDAVQEGRLTRVDGDANCSTLRYSTRCELTEQLTFDVPEVIVRRLASAYRPGVNNSWQFKLKGRYSNTDLLNGIVPAEAAGLLMMVDAYRARITPLK